MSPHRALTGGIRASCPLEDDAGSAAPTEVRARTRTSHGREDHGNESALIAKSTIAAVAMWRAAGLRGRLLVGCGRSLQGRDHPWRFGNTPPSNYVKDVLAPAFTQATGINVEFETTSWDQMYDKAIKDMEANTGIYDFVYIEQDIIYSYLSRDFLVDITQSLKDTPALASPDFNSRQLHHLHRQFQGPTRTTTCSACRWRPSSRSTSIARICSTMPRSRKPSRRNGRDLAPAKTHEEYREIAEFFTQWGKDNSLELWGTTVQAHTGHPASWYEFFESVAPTFGVYNWGINANKNYAASVANGGQMNSDKAKAALEWWLGNSRIRPAGIDASTWDEVAATFAAGRAAQGLVYGENAAWIATNADKSQVVGKVGITLPPLGEGVMAAAEAGKGYIGYYDGGAFGIPTRRRTRKRRCCSCSISVRTRSSPTGRSAGVAHRHERRPMTIRRSTRWTPRSTTTTR